MSNMTQLLPIIFLSLLFLVGLCLYQLGRIKGFHDFVRFYEEQLEEVKSEYRRRLTSKDDER